MRAARAGNPGQSIDRKRLVESGLDVLQDALELGIRQAVRPFDVYIVVDTKQPDRQRGANAVGKQGAARCACIEIVLERASEMFDALVTKQMARVEPRYQRPAAKFRRHPLHQGRRQDDLNRVERGFSLETALLASRHQVDIAGAPDEIAPNLIAVGACRRACMHHDAMVRRPRQTMHACLNVPGDHCDVGWGSGRSELWTHALSIHGETCSRFGNSRAIFNAAKLYARLSIKLGREVAMSFYVVVGAGPVGRETARLLGEEGHDVVLTSRSVGSNALPNVRTVQADATDASELSRICRGADAIFMCAMAAYHRWPTDFFPIIDGTVRAAEAVGAKLIVLGNLYGYGENADSPLRSDLPLDPTSRKGTARTIMWQRAVRAGIPAIEIRSSDYLGHGAISYFSLIALPAIIEGKPTAFIGDLDATHAWAFTKDVARTLVAAALYKGEWGRAFHVPSQYASPRELIQKAAAMLGQEVSGTRSYSVPEIEALGMHEAIEMSYLFEKPLLVDASDTEALLGVKASSLEEMIADTLRDHL